VVKKRIPFYDFKNQIINQLQGHYFYYHQKRKPIEREIVHLLADIILKAELFTFPSDYGEYIPIVRVDYGYKKDEKSNWMVQFKQSDISYAIVNTNNKDIIEKVLLLSKSNISRVKSLNLFFYKYNNEWLFPTHCIIETSDGHQTLNFLDNKRTDKNVIIDYIDIMNKIYKKMDYFIRNNKIEMESRKNKLDGDRSFIPKIFYEESKPNFRLDILKRYKKDEESMREVLRKFAKSVLK
jgi:hypothetical protein